MNAESEKKPILVGHPELECISIGAAGADPASVRIVVWEESPIAYLPGNAIRLRAKAAGRMAPVA